MVIRNNAFKRSFLLGVVFVLCAISFSGMSQASRQEELSSVGAAVTPQSQLRVGGTFSKLGTINNELMQSVQQDKSLAPDLKVRLMSLCSYVSSTIATSIGIAQSAARMTVSTAHFMFSVKGLLTLAVLGCLSQYIIGSDLVFSHGVLPVTEKLASYVAYLTGNLVKNVVVGLKTPVEECLNSVECNGQIQDLIAQVSTLAAQATAAGTNGVSQGLLSFVWNNPGQALASAVTAATYGSFNLAKLVVPAFVLAKVR